MKSAERAGALALAAAAVDGGGLDAGAAELLGEPIGTVAGAGEDDGGPHRVDGLGGESLRARSWLDFQKMWWAEVMSGVSSPTS